MSGSRNVFSTIQNVVLRRHSADPLDSSMSEPKTAMNTPDSRSKKSQAQSPGPRSATAGDLESPSSPFELTPLKNLEPAFHWRSGQEHFEMPSESHRTWAFSIFGSMPCVYCKIQLPTGELKRLGCKTCTLALHSPSSLLSLHPLEQASLLFDRLSLGNLASYRSEMLRNNAVFGFVQVSATPLTCPTQTRFKHAFGHCRRVF